VGGEGKEQTWEEERNERQIQRGERDDLIGDRGQKCVSVGGDCNRRHGVSVGGIIENTEELFCACVDAGCAAATTVASAAGVYSGGKGTGGDVWVFTQLYLFRDLTELSVVHAVV